MLIRYVVWTLKRIKLNKEIAIISIFIRKYMKPPTAMTTHQHHHDQLAIQNLYESSQENLADKEGASADPTRATLGLSSGNFVRNII